MATIQGLRGLTPGLRTLVANMSRGRVHPAAGVAAKGRATLLRLASSLFLMLLPAAARAQTVTTSISDPDGLFSMAVNPVTNKIYAANRRLLLALPLRHFFAPAVSVLLL